MNRPERRRAWRIYSGRTRRTAWSITRIYTEPRTKRQVLQGFRSRYAKVYGYRTWIVPIRKKLSTVIPTRE